MKKEKMQGQSLLEYLVLVGVVVLGSIAGLSYFKNQITDSFNTVINAMTDK